MTKTDALERLERLFAIEPDNVRMEAYLEGIGPFSDAQVSAACKTLERTATWFPKLAELLEQCRIEQRRAQANIGPQPDDDPRTWYRCSECQDAGFQILYCPGGDLRTCGRTHANHWEHGTFIASCKRPHQFARPCVCRSVARAS